MAGAQVWAAGKWALADDDANGLYASSATATLSRETAFGRNHVGDEVVMAMFNEQAEYNLRGLTVTAATTGADIATALTTAQSAMYTTDYDDATPEIYVNRIELTRSNTDFEQGSVTAVGRVGISGAGSPVT